MNSIPIVMALAVRFCGLTPTAAIAAETVNAATELGLHDRGTIEAGRRTDLILLQRRDERDLVHEPGGKPVAAVICGGVRQHPDPGF